MVRDQRKQHWNSANSAHCAHRRQFGPLSQLFQTYSSSRTVFFGSEKQRPPPSPGPPSTAKQLASITPDSSRARNGPAPGPAWLHIIPFYGRARRGNPFLAGERAVEIQGAATLTSDPRMSVCLLQSTLFFTTNPRPLLAYPSPSFPTPSFTSGG